MILRDRIWVPERIDRKRSQPHGCGTIRRWEYPERFVSEVRFSKEEI